MNTADHDGRNGRAGHLDSLIQSLADTGQQEIEPGFCGHGPDMAALIAEIWDFAEGDLDPDTERAVETRIEACACCAHCYRRIAEAQLAVRHMPRRSLAEVAAGLGLSVVAPQSAGPAAKIASAAGFILRLVADGIEALQFPGRIVPVPVPSRGEAKAEDWKGGLQVDYELAGRRLTLIATSVQGGACKVRLLSAKRSDDLAGLAAELHSEGRRICFQPFRETATGWVWESDRIRPGSYRLVLRRGSDALGEVDVTVLDQPSRQGGKGGVA